MQHRVRRLVGRLVRRVERAFGDGPLTRADNAQAQLAVLRQRVASLERSRRRDQSRLDAIREDLEAVRRRRDEIQARLERTREQHEQERVVVSDHGALGPIHALRGQGSPCDRSRRLVYPGASSTNPYTRILYHRAPGCGFVPTPIRSVWTEDLAAPDVLHIHWPDHVTALAANRDTAAGRMASYLDALDTARERGAHLVWSVHETAGHDAPYPDLDLELRAELARRASAIHLLHDGAAVAVNGAYTLPAERCFTVEHPLYTGVYPDIVGRADARAHLGFAPDDLVLLCFGALRHNKGVDRLVRRLDELQGTIRGRAQLIVAGPSHPTTDVTALQRLCDSREDVRLHIGAVSDDAVQYLFRAADLCVLPYRPGSLNSGVLMLAWTFDTPVIAPRNPVTSELRDRGPARLFRAEDDDELVEVTAGAIVDGFLGEVRLDPDVRERLSPHRISGEFAEQLANRLADQVSIPTALVGA